MKKRLDDQMKKSVQVNLRKLRLKYDLKQRQVAEGIGRTRSDYGGVENGSFNPSLDFLLSIIQFYKKSFNEILSLDRLLGISTVQ